ncbi:MAG: glycosyltransferase family 4 protein [bacterium]
MKVVYFNYVHDYKETSVGSWTHVKQFSTAFTNLGHTISVHSLNLKNKSIKKEKVLEKSVLRKVAMKFGRDLKNFLKNFGYALNEITIIKKEKPDVAIIRHNPYVLSSLLVCKIFQVPTILEFNAPGAFQVRKYENEFFHLPFLFEFLEWLALRLASAITVTCKEMIPYLNSSKEDLDKIVVNPMGVDFDHFNNKHSKSNEILHKRNGNLVLGFVGSLNHWHGIDNLLNIIKIVLSKYEHCKFLIVGDGVKFKEIKQFIKENKTEDSVILTGYIPYEKLPDYINAMDITLAPYPSDMVFYYSPLKIFEYMATGKPILATKIGQIAEIMTGQNIGMFIKPENLLDLENKLNAIITDEMARTNMGKNARKLARQFSWDRNAKVVQELCKSLI